LSAINLAQQIDIDLFIAACQKAVDAGETELIGFGASKGAATVCNSLHFLHRSSDPKHKKILNAFKAVVAICPFADISDSEMMAGFSGPLKPVAQRLLVSDRLGIGRACMGSVMKTAFSYNPFGMTPLKAAADMPSIPLFLAHSREDQLIPVNHSRKIYAELVQKPDHKDVYLFEFDGGDHVDSIFGNGVNSMWQTPMNQFLEKYLFNPVNDIIVADNKAQPVFNEVDAQISKQRVIPSLGYGLLFATCFEVSKYVKHRWDEKKREEMQVALQIDGAALAVPFKRARYQRTMKRSLVYGLVVAGLLEAVNQLRK
jgi:hypothetical protein